MLLLRFKSLLYILDNSSLFDLLFASIFDQSKSEKEDLKLNEVLLINHFMDRAKYNLKTYILDNLFKFSIILSSRIGHFAHQI